MNPLADRRWLAGSLVAALILAWTVAGTVLGHAELVSSDPKNGAVLATPPTVITLTFSEALDATKSSFKVIGPSGSVGTGAVAGDPSGMSLVNLELTPGDYEIQWTSVAVDGHVARGILTFTVSEPTPAPATPTPAPSATEAPSAAPSVAATPAPTPPPTPAPSAAPTAPASSSGDVLLPIVVALALVAGAGSYLLRRGRRA